MNLVAGLGNPGSRYETTRHNAGFLVVDELVRRWDGTLKKDRFGSSSGDALIRNNKVHLAKPQKFMNRSGAPLRGLLDYFGGDAGNLIVIHDEVDLPFGTIRIKQSGGHGGHNGLRDIHKHLGSNAYARVRFGVGRPPEGWETADYVLGRWSASEAAELDSHISHAANAVETIIEHGLEAAMNQFHVREKTAQPTTAGQDRSQSFQAQVAYGV